MCSSYKKADFREKSGVFQCKCGAYIKMNMIIKKLEPPRICYKCWVRQERASGHLMRESARSGKAIS